MATVKGDIRNTLSGGVYQWYGEVLPYDVTARALCDALNIPPDTENTPHAIAAAVLGITEDDLRRRLLNEHDYAFYVEAFTLAQAVQRFLRRVRTQRVIDAGMLDADVVAELVESADRIDLIRTQRVQHARLTRPEDDR